MPSALHRAAAPLAAALALLLGETAMALEEPPFRVLESEGAFELRAYAPHVVAAVEVDGRDRGEAMGRGFRLLANYIFGGNRAGQKMEMTAPVTGQRTAAGTAQAERWKVTFLMPSSYAPGTLPVPNDARVQHEQLPGRTVATLRFSGWATDGNVARHLQALNDALAARGLRPRGEPVLAQYDPPWALPFWRRNEWTVEVED